MTIGCADCGIEQRIPELPERTAAECRRCGKLLDLSENLDLTIGLAWMLATFLLLIPASSMPLMSVSLGTVTHVSTLGASVATLWEEHWPILATMFAAYAIVLPFVRSGLMLVVLTGVALDRRPSWLGRAFRYAENVRIWAMPEVVVLAGLVLYLRTNVRLEGHVQWGGWCLIAAAALAMLTPWVLAPQRVWRQIMPDRPRTGDRPDMSCDVCNMVLPLSEEEARCPRCRRRMHLRKPNSMQHTAALVVASYILYIPSYYFAMSYTVRPGGVKHRSIMDGIGDLINAGFWALAAIILIASVVIPMLKLVGLSWLVMSVRHPSRRFLVLRTKLYRVIRRIGRWSNTDPFIVALMAPMLSFPGVVEVHMARAALPFALVVAFTMLAAHNFDSRLMWDAAEGRLWPVGDARPEHGNPSSREGTGRAARRHP